jgi:hypothetical protein
VASVLAEGYRTADLLAATGDATGLKPVGTQAMGDAVVAALDGAALDARPRPAPGADR